MRIRDEAHLARLLREAAEAHHAYEAEIGSPDDDWPNWYARYILDGRKVGLDSFRLRLADT